MTRQPHKFNRCIRVICFNLLLQIRDDDSISAPPSSPVLSEKEECSLNAISEEEEDEYFSGDTDDESQEEVKSKSFSHPARQRLFTPKERCNSEPALPTYLDWEPKKIKVKRTTGKRHFYAPVLLDSRSTETRALICRAVKRAVRSWSYV